MPTKIKSNTFTQADGVVEVKTNWHKPDLQVSFGTDSTAGTVAVAAKYHPTSEFETIFEEDGTTPLVINLTDLKTFQLLGKWVYSLQFTPSGVDVSYTPCIAQGKLTL